MGKKGGSCISSAILIISHDIKIPVPGIETLLSSVVNMSGIAITFCKFVKRAKLARTDNVQLEIQLEKKRQN